MTAPRFKTKRGRLTPYSFACGYVERIGCVVLGMHHGVYLACRNPWFGHAVEGSRSLTEARRIAARLRRTAQPV